MVAPKKPKRASTRRKGMAPDQYRRRSVVYVERVRRPDEQADTIHDDLTTTDIWNVETDRLGGNFTHILRMDGQTTRIPGKVIESVIRQRDSISKEGRSEAGKAAMAARVRQLQVQVYEAGAMEADKAKDLGMVTGQTVLQ